MPKRKICVVVTARPSYSRIRTALQAIKRHPDLELQLVVAASALLDRYGNAVQAIERDGFEIDERVYMVLEGENLVTSAKSTGIGLSELATVFDNLEPDAVVTVADRYETLATAVAASYMNIPVVHVQGGEVTGSIDEKVRHAVTKLSNLHLVSTPAARERVLRLGEPEDTVVVTGCPSIDIAAEVAAQSRRSTSTPSRSTAASGPTADLSKGYLVVMQHPVTTEYEEARAQVEETLYAVTAFGLPVLWFWPNAGRRLRRHLEGHPRVPRARAAGPLPSLPQHVPRGLPAAAGALHRDRRQQQRRHPRVLVPRRAGGEHRLAAAGARARPQRDRRRPRPRGHHRRRSATHVRRGRVPSDHLYGDGRAGARIADCLATAPLTVEKRLTY